MSKKTFKGANPALQFIEQARQAEEAAVKEERKEAEKIEAHKTENTDKAHNTDKTYKTENTDTAHDAATRDEYAGAARHSTNDGKETKSKRLNLLLQPSVFEDVTKIAHMKRTSANDLINAILKDYAEREAETIMKYDEVFGDGRAG
jgi:hypothetical protein